MMTKAMIAMVAVAALVLGSWRVAHACDCGGTLASGIAHADAVFWGEIVAEVPHEKHSARFTVEVKGVWKGSVTKRMYVFTDASSCGFKGLGKVRFLFVTTEQDSRLWAHLCDGSQLATQKVRDQVTKIAGPARAPKR